MTTNSTKTLSDTPDPNASTGILIVLILCTLGCAGWLLFGYDTTVSSPDGTSVNNIGKLTLQQCGIICCMGVLIASSIGLAANRIVKAIEKRHD